MREDRDGPERSSEDERRSLPSGHPTDDRAEQSPAGRDAQGGGQPILAPERAQEAAAQAGVDRAQEDGHDPEGRVAGPVGLGPAAGTLAEPRVGLVRLGVASHIRCRRGVGEQHDRCPEEALGPSAIASAPLVVGRG